MPEDYDLDLKSIQEARRLLISCREAQRQFAFASQETVDRICKAMAEAAFGAAVGGIGARHRARGRWRTGGSGIRGAGPRASRTALSGATRLKESG